MSFFCGELQGIVTDQYLYNVGSLLQQRCDLIATTRWFKTSYRDEFSPESHYVMACNNCDNNDFFKKKSATIFILVEIMFTIIPLCKAIRQ